MAPEHGPPAPAGRRRRVVAAVLALAAVAGGMATLAGAAGPTSPAGAATARVVDEAAVTPMNVDLAYSSNSPVLLAEPGEPRFVVMANRLDAPDFACSLQVSGDGGRTWVTAHPVPKLPRGAEKCYAPEVAFDGDGNLYYLFVGLAGRGNRPMGAFLTTSRDRGATFGPPRRVLGPLRFAVRLAVDADRGQAGRIHLAWIEATSDPSLGGFGPPPNPILTAHSDDGGRTFSRPVQVSDRHRRRVVAPALALGPGGEVHVAYFDLGRDAVDYQGLEGPVWEEPWSLVLATSRDGGRTFGKGRVVDDGVVPVERVMLIFTMAPPALVTGRGGLVCAAWADARHGDGDAMVRCSPDGGRTWRPARRLNDDRVGNGVRQYLPRLSVSPRGRVDAVFLDRRDDPRNVRNHVYLAYSLDAGRRFSPNLRVSREPSDTRVGQQYAHAAAAGQFEIGSRLGLLSDRARAVAAWPDARHSSTGSTAQDLFAATVALPEPPAEPGAARAAGAGLCVAGAGTLLGLAAGRRRRARQPAVPG